MESTLGYSPCHSDLNLRRLRRSDGLAIHQVLRQFQHAHSFAMIAITVAYLVRGASKRHLDASEPEAGSDSTWLISTVLIFSFFLNRSWHRITSAKEYVFRIVSRSSKKTLQSCRSSSNALKSFAKVSSSQALSQLARVSSHDALKRFSCSIFESFTSRPKRAALRAITAKECFARLDYIGQLSVKDVSVLFHYARVSNKSDFDRKVFLSEQSKLIRSMVTAMDMAVTVSRGTLAAGKKIDSAALPGDIDALYFVAASRIFAEWRSLRLVPSGYKRYSVAMGLALRDALQNLMKIENAVHSYLKCQVAAQDGNIEAIPSPSLRQLLQHELQTNVHPNLPRLTDNSAASGLLWTKRQIHYQVSVFQNTLDIPVTFPNAKEGALAAYKEVYEAYHGWAVKQVFQHSLGGTPPVEDIWRQMQPPERPAEDDCTKVKIESSQAKRIHIPRLPDVSEETLPLDGANEFVFALDSFGRHVASEWNKMLRHFNCVSDDEHRHSNLILSRESLVNMNALDKSILLEPITHQTHVRGGNDHLFSVKDNIRCHTRHMMPMLEDISKLIDEFHMNDPTKV